MRSNGIGVPFHTKSIGVQPGIPLTPDRIPLSAHRDGGNSARYLDAHLREGDTPWALELKAALSGSGLRVLPARGRPSRPLPAVHQDRDPAQGLVQPLGTGPDEGQGGVVLPELTTNNPDLVARQEALCAMFLVELFWSHPITPHRTPSRARTSKATLARPGLPAAASSPRPQRR